MIMANGGKQALAGHGSWFCPPKPPPPCDADGARKGGRDFDFYASTQTINSSGPNRRGKYKSAYHKQPFDRQMVHDMFAALTTTAPGLSRDDMKQSLIQVDCFGGRINDVEPEATVIAQRSYKVKLQFQTYWDDEAEDEPHLAWIRSAYESCHGGGVYRTRPVGRPWTRARRRTSRRSRGATTTTPTWT